MALPLNLTLVFLLDDGPLSATIKVNGNETKVWKHKRDEKGGDGECSECGLHSDNCWGPLYKECNVVALKAKKLCLRKHNSSPAYLGPYNGFSLEA